MSLRTEASAAHETRSDHGHRVGRRKRRQSSDKGVETINVPATAARRLSGDIGCSSTVFCAVLLLPLLLMVVALTLLAVSGSGARRAARAFAGITSTLHGLCDEGVEGDKNRSVTCRQTLERLSLTMKADADPCDDFYEHVCGNWKPRYPNRPSYLKEHMESFNVLVHQTLLQLAISAPPHWAMRLPAAAHQMAVFHYSCYAMATGRGPRGHATGVARALGTDGRSWINVVSHEALIDLTLRTTRTTGLPSFLKYVRTNCAPAERDTTYVYAGETLLSTLRFQHKVSELLVEVLRAFNVDFKFHFSRLFDADRDVARIFESSVEGQSANAQGQSNFSSVHMLSTTRNFLGGNLGNATVTGLANLRGDPAAIAAIGRLRSEPLSTAGLYALSVLLAQVMKYSLLLRELYVPNPSDNVRWCLQQTAEHFGELYTEWVARKFQKHQALATVRGLFADIRMLLMRDNRVNRGVLVGTGRLKRTHLCFYGQDGLKAIVPPAPQFPALLGNSFLNNLAIAFRSRVARRPSDDRSAEFVLSGFVGYHGDSFVVTPAYLSGHGVLALRVDEVDVFYPTLAALMLRAIYNDSAFYSPESMANYTDGCFSESVSFALGRYVAPRAVMPFMGNRWAIFFASFLSRRRAADVHRRLGDHGRAHLYFRLVCFFSCGDLTMRDTCNDVAYSSDDLSRSIGCHRERSIKCDCNRLDNCETHMPRA
ncbi:uncharacterized protein LOC119375094 [Rhipicephalus sanguineus]|uniref:uncharacterized protein LOC119375094 n=1 Tax=Rhipicephalus sanguineus TaxID=34632 RepID=UPI001895D44F|nr:uncharacterized protein LOC119375094 [Rhipicephalus sanguineus]